MNTHSPGPWSVKMSTRPINGQFDHLILDATRHTVAVVYGATIDGSDQVLPAEANARGMAAYPLLVAALLDLVIRCDGAAGELADGSNIDTAQAHHAIDAAGGWPNG